MISISPIKFIINHLLENKCSNCKDISFCKLRELYKKVNEPDIQQLKHLENCLYFRKKQI